MVQPTRHQREPSQTLHQAVHVHIFLWSIPPTTGAAFRPGRQLCVQMVRPRVLMLHTEEESEALKSS